MNRRNFLKILAGVALVPSAVARALSSESVPTGMPCWQTGDPYADPGDEGVEIHKYLRSNWRAGTWIVCGKDQADILRKLPEFSPITGGSRRGAAYTTIAMDQALWKPAVRLIGVLSLYTWKSGVCSDKSYRVFEDDYLPPEMMLVGWKDLLEMNCAAGGESIRHEVTNTWHLPAHENPSHTPHSRALHR